IHKVYNFKLSVFDEVVEHPQHVEVAKVFDLRPFFLKLWLFRVLPQSLGQLVISPEELEPLKAQDLLPKSAPVVSTLSFKKFLEQEEQLAPSNRYTFIHLIV